MSQISKPGGQGRGPGPFAAGSKARCAWKSHGGGKCPRKKMAKS